MAEPELVRELLLAGLLASAGAAGFAQVTLSETWIRGTVPQQKATDMFAQLTSAQGDRSLSASSQAAGVVEIHERLMNGKRHADAAAGLELPAGKAAALKPGGYHVMLMDLKQPLKAGETVPVSLRLVDRQRKPETAQRFRAFKASLMPSLTPTVAGNALMAAVASRSL
jgi:copper(I)-binding protein